MCELWLTCSDTHDRNFCCPSFFSRVAQIEEMTKVPHKFRFPFFTELQWFAMDKFVYHLMGRTHLNLEEETLVRYRYFLLQGPQRQTFEQMNFSFL